jgi:hypothetical protein
MKEQTLVEMKNKVDGLVTFSKQMAAQLDNLRDLSVGTLEILKNMPAYQDAVNKLKDDVLNRKDGQLLEIPKE